MLDVVPRRPQRSTILAGLLVAGIAAAVVLPDHGPSDRERVEAYCAYGAISAAQWRGCVDHVTIDQVRHRNSRASQFALHGGDCPRSTYCAAWQEGESAGVRQSTPHRRDTYAPRRYGRSSDAYGGP